MEAWLGAAVAGRGDPAFPSSGTRQRRSVPAAHVFEHVLPVRQPHDANSG
jgi:hypothetical protein